MSSVDIWFFPNRNISFNRTNQKLTRVKGLFAMRGLDADDDAYFTDSDTADPMTDIDPMQRPLLFRLFNKGTDLPFRHRTIRFVVQILDSMTFFLAADDSQKFDRGTISRIGCLAMPSFNINGAPC